MGIMFPPPALTEQEWLCGTPYEEMVNYAIHLGSARKFTLAKVAQFRRAWSKLDEECKSAVVTVEKHTDAFAASGINLQHAAFSHAFTRLYSRGIESPSAVEVRDLHEVFGNPFRPTAFDPAWRTSDAIALAKGIYDDRAFDRMPILADALQDAGCDSDDILNHLRDPHATHVRGCWALDLVLGKE
jgi:hypothetical protein